MKKRSKKRMLHDTAYISTLELIFTSGFIKIMLLIWLPLVIYIPIFIMIRKL